MALEYKLPYTGKEIEQKLNKVDDILYQIIDPDNYPIGDIGEDETKVIALEVGKLSRSSGAEVDQEEGLRTPDFIAVNGGENFKVIFEEMADQGKFCFLLYDSSYAFIDIGWNEGYAYSHRASGTYLSIPSDINAAYMKGYISSTNNTEGSLTLIKKTLESPKAEHKKIYIADHGYSIYGDIIDDPTMHKLVIKAEGKDNNHYNIVEIKAPSDNPQESTLALMNWGNGIKQFVDFSSMAYDVENPTVEIVCQTRGGEPLPEFSVRYNDGKGAGRVKKLVITPDCIPIKLTSEGIEVRRNNNYNNDATDEELVTINLADLYDKVNLIYDALVANGTITTN